MANVRYPGTAGTTPGTITAADVTYDNTTSGLTADDVQEAIDEIEGQISSLSYDASDISYDNTTSGLTADDVQEAIDEVDSNVDTLSSTVTTLSGKVYKTDDSTETTIASDDLLPIYDTSATASKKITVANVVKATVSNPNLIDNPWFTVNQRGQSSYSTNGAYTVDRWKNWSTEGETVAVNSDHSITLNKSASDKIVNITQVMEEDVGELLVGKTVTLSALLSDGTIRSVSGVVVKDNTFILQVYLDNTTKFKLDFYRYSNIWNIRVISWGGGTSAAGSITIKAIKLELGSISTLAMDTAPNYATELLKCQRYFVRFQPTIDGYASMGGLGYCFTANQARLPLQVPVAMRTNPVVTVSGVGMIGIDTPGEIILSPNDIASFDLYDNVSNIHFSFVMNTTNTLTVGKLGYVRAMNDVTAYIDLSADL